MLRAAELEYKLDDPSQAKDYNGQNAKVSGTLDQQSNTLHIHTIESFPSK